MATHDVQNVSYMRKDAHFLADGIWYISTPCVKHGLVDEEVPWADAKTPHHAGLIADQRHAACFREADQVNQRAEAAAETEAARGEVTRAEHLLERAQRAVADLDTAIAADRQVLLDAVPDEQVLDDMLKSPNQRDNRLRQHRALRAQRAAAQDELAKYERGIGEARQRLRDTEQANAVAE